MIHHQKSPASFCWILFLFSLKSAWAELSAWLKRWTQDPGAGGSRSWNVSGVGQLLRWTSAGEDHWGIFFPLETMVEVSVISKGRKALVYITKPMKGTYLSRSPGDPRKPFPSSTGVLWVPDLSGPACATGITTRRFWTAASPCKTGPRCWDLCSQDLSQKSGQTTIVPLERMAIQQMGGGLLKKAIQQMVGGFIFLTKDVLRRLTHILRPTWEVQQSELLNRHRWSGSMGRWVWVGWKELWIFHQARPPFCRSLVLWWELWGLKSFQAEELSWEDLGRWENYCNARCWINFKPVLTFFLAQKNKPVVLSKLLL